MCNCGAKRNLPGGRGISRAPVQTRQVTVTVTTTPPRSILMTRGRKVVSRSYDVVRTVPVEPVDTKVWGAHVWRILHTVSLYTAPKFWTGVASELDGALPCPECAQHYHDWLRAHPFTTATEWCVALHNDVNKRKNVAAWTVADMEAAYRGVTVDTVRGSLSAVEGLLGSRGVAALRRLVDNMIIPDVVAEYVAENIVAVPDPVTVVPVTVVPVTDNSNTEMPALVIDETTE